MLCLHCILRKEEAMESQIYTVSEVNGFIKNVIDGIPQLSGIYSEVEFRLSSVSGKPYDR